MNDMSTEMSEDELFLDEGGNDAIVQEQETPEVETVVEASDNPEPLPEVVEAVAETPIEAEAEKPDEQANVPSWRLREVNEARIAAETAAQAAKNEYDAKLAQTNFEMQNLRNQIAQQQQPQAPVDMFENPEGWQEQQQSQFNNVVESLQIQIAQMKAGEQHTPAKRDEAWAAALAAQATTPGLAQRIGNAANPWLEAVAWYDNKQLADTIGNEGIDAFKERIIAEHLANPEVQQQVIDKARTGAGVGVAAKSIPTIPNMNGASRVTVDSLPSSDEELFNS